MRIGLLLLLSACSGTDTLFVESPWAPDVTVLLVVADAEGNPVMGPLLGKGQRTTLSVEAQPPFVLHAGIYDDLDPTCEVFFEGDGESLPLPQLAYVADVESASDDVRFTASSERQTFGARTSCDLKNCPEINVESTALPLAVSVSDLVALSATDVLVADAVTGTHIALVTSSGPRLLDATGVMGPILELDRDGSDVVGATSLGAFRLDLVDETFEFESYPSSVRGVAGVPGGPPVIYGDFGFREAFTVSTATTSVERFGARARHAHFISLTDGLVIDEGNFVWHYDGSWTMETPKGSVGVESYKRVAGRGDSFLLVGRRETAVLRVDGTWVVLPPPFDRGFSLTDVSPLGDGFVVIGSDRTIAIYRDREWCAYQLEDGPDVSRVSAPLGEDDVFFIGTLEDTDGRPRALRVTLSY